MDDMQRKTGIIAIVGDDEPLRELLGSVTSAAGLFDRYVCLRRRLPLLSQSAIHDPFNPRCAFPRDGRHRVAGGCVMPTAKSQSFSSQLMVMHPEAHCAQREREGILRGAIGELRPTIRQDIEL